MVISYSAHFFSEKFLGLVSSYNKTILCNDENKDIDKLCVEHEDRGNGECAEASQRGLELWPNTPNNTVVF